MSKPSNPARDSHFSAQQSLQQARQAWEESMLRQVGELRASLQNVSPQWVAARCGGEHDDRNKNHLRLRYWGRWVEISWPELKAVYTDSGEAVSVSDQAMLLYYLRTADGAPLADAWVSFRELPDGGFYHLAFQGYSGDELAKAFDPQPTAFHIAAKALDGIQLTGITEYAYAFQPLPRVRLAAVFWPGDEEFAGRASILFDGAAGHYLPIDGLAGLGARLAHRLIRQLST